MSASRAACRARRDPTTSATRSGSAPLSTSRANRSRSTEDFPVPAAPVTRSAPSPCARTASCRTSGDKGGFTDRMLPPVADTSEVGPRRDTPPASSGTGCPEDPSPVPAVDVPRREAAEQSLALEDERLPAARDRFERPIERQVRRYGTHLLERGHRFSDTSRGVAPPDPRRRREGERADHAPESRRRPGTPSSDPHGDASRGRGAVSRRRGSAPGEGSSPPRPVRRTGLGAPGPAWPPAVPD